MTASLDDDTLKQLLDGTISWNQLREEILPDPKDENRFLRIRDILQQRVDWEEPILLPLNDHLFAIGTPEGRRVKAECGQLLGTLEENWKTHCQVRIRESKQDMMELYPEWQIPDPDWTFQLREFYCPGCYQLLEVDAVPAGYPVLQEFAPDVDTFYREWLDTDPPDAQWREKP